MSRTEVHVGYSRSRSSDRYWHIIETPQHIIGMAQRLYVYAGVIREIEVFLDNYNYSWCWSVCMSSQFSKYR